MSLHIGGRTRSLIDSVMERRDAERDERMRAAPTTLPVVKVVPKHRLQQGERPATFICKCCGAEGPQSKHGRLKDFCDESCRRALERKERQAIREAKRADFIEAVKRCHLRGLSAAAIGRVLGVSQHAVADALHAEGLTPHGGRE
jgi:hypothetical protein